MYSAGIKIKLENIILFSSGNIEIYDHVCVPIQGSCDLVSVPRFIINGDWTLWPTPGNRNYNVTYSEASDTYRFCFINVTGDIILAEYCYQQHTAGCSICYDAESNSNEIMFLSYSNIFVSLGGKSYVM